MSRDEEQLFREPGTLEHSHIVVRELKLEDVDAVVRLDSRIVGRPRHEYLKRKIEDAVNESGVRISLAAEIDGMFVGILLGRLYYGEFGLPEPIAIIDTVGVDPDFNGQGVGSALFEQLETNMRGFGIEKIQTQVDWQTQDLIGFLAARGFSPAPVICLEKRLDD